MTDTADLERKTLALAAEHSISPSEALLMVLLADENATGKYGEKADALIEKTKHLGGYWGNQWKVRKILIDNPPSFNAPSGAFDVSGPEPLWTVVDRSMFPLCIACKKVFPAREEWDDHRCAAHTKSTDDWRRATA